MLKIAICDDERSQRVNAALLLDEFFSSRPELAADLSFFASAASLLSQSKSFDLYLLDVLMPGTNGIELGLELRKRDAAAIIIYLTTSSDYAVDSYLARAFHYLLKPLEREKLFPVLDEAVLKLTNGQNVAVTVKTKDGVRRVAAASVVCVELYERCALYQLSDGSSVKSLNIRGSFKDAVSPLLDFHGFVLCSVSFAVNLAFVERIDREGLHLRNGKRLPLTRSFKESVMDNWVSYCFGGTHNAH